MFLKSHGFCFENFIDGFVLKRKKQEKKMGKKKKKKQLSLNLSEFYVLDGFFLNRL
jgi:hypothetical protein